MKHIAFFKEFLAEEVNLNQTRINVLNDRVASVKGFLKANLSSYQGLEKQGSYGLGTIIKPVRQGQEYDADVLLYMRCENRKPARAYLQELYNCLKSSRIYADRAQGKTRCIRLNYAGDFHLDIVPCIMGTNGFFICNYRDNAFEITDGVGYRDWFNGQNAITAGNLKRVTRLLKYLRDHKGNFSVKSILLTTLIGKTVGIYDGSNFQNIPEALKTVSNRINDFLQSHSRVPQISNPVLSAEDFTRHWNQEIYDNFRKRFDLYTGKINSAYEATDHDDSIDQWREVFGDKFGKKRNSGISGAPFAVTPKPPWAQ